MLSLKYTVIKNKRQYREYCDLLELFFFLESKQKSTQQEIELLTLLIEKWDSEHISFHEIDPIKLLRALMDENNMRAKQLVELLDVSKGYVSDILNYKKGLSKDVIRKLSEHFKLTHEAFNRPYKLNAPKKSRVIRSRKKRKKRIAA